MYEVKKYLDMDKHKQKESPTENVNVLVKGCDVRRAMHFKILQYILTESFIMDVQRLSNKIGKPHTLGGGSRIH